MNNRISTTAALVFLLASALPLPPTSVQAADTALTPYTAIGAGDYHTCALQAHGDVVCWGGYAAGTGQEYGAVDASQTYQGPALALSVAFARACAVLATGDVTCWGYNTPPGGPNPYTEGDAVAVAMGSSHTCVLTVAHNVQCWGGNSYGQRLTYTGGHATAVGAGNSHTCILLDTGNIDCQGSNTYGQSSDYSGRNARAISLGRDHTCALLSNGNIDCWGSNGNGQAADYLGGNAKAVAAGGANTCALLTTGNVQCWGSTQFGQNLGHTGGDAIAVSVGTSHACALLQLGTIDCWGSNYYGEGGDRGTPPSGTPSPPVEDADSDGAATVTEAQVGSHPLRYVSQPGSDDDGDGTVNAYEVLNEYEVLPLQCTGAYGYIRSSVCNGYGEPSGHTGQTRSVENAWRDNAGFVWVFDSICLPAALNGDYTTCKNTGNRALSSTTYKGDWTSDGYGWRHIDANSVTGATVPSFSSCGVNDDDGDFVPTVHICQSTITIKPDGTIQQGPATPWMEVGDSDATPVDPHLEYPAVGIPPADGHGYIVVPVGRDPIIKETPAPDANGRVAILFFVIGLTPSSTDIPSQLKALDPLGSVVYSRWMPIYTEDASSKAGLVYFEAIPTQGVAKLQFSYGQVAQEVEVNPPDLLGRRICEDDSSCVNPPSVCEMYQVPVVCGPVPPPPPPCQQPVVKDVPPCRPAPPPPPPCEQPVVKDVPPCKPAPPPPCVTVDCLCDSVPGAVNLYPCGGTQPCSPPASCLPCDPGPILSPGTASASSEPCSVRACDDGNGHTDCIPPVGCPDGTVDCYVCLDRTNSAQASAITNCMPTVSCSDLSCIDDINLLECEGQGLIQCLIGRDLPCETNFGMASPTAGCIDGLPCMNSEDNCLDPGPVCEDGCLPERDIDPPSCDNSMDAEPNARIGCGIPIAPPTCATSTRAPAIGCGVTISSGACQAPTCYEFDMPLTAQASESGQYPHCGAVFNVEPMRSPEVHEEQNRTDANGRPLYRQMNYTTVSFGALIRYENTCNAQSRGSTSFIVSTHWSGPRWPQTGSPFPIFADLRYRGAEIECNQYETRTEPLSSCKNNAEHHLWVRPDTQAYVWHPPQADPELDAHVTFGGVNVTLNGSFKGTQGCEPQTQNYAYAFDVATLLLGSLPMKAVQGIVVGSAGNFFSDFLHREACRFTRWEPWTVEVPDGQRTKRIGNGVLMGPKYEGGISMKKQIEGQVEIDMTVGDCIPEGYNLQTGNRAQWDIAVSTDGNGNGPYDTDRGREGDGLWTWQKIAMNCLRDPTQEL